MKTIALKISAVLALASFMVVPAYAESKTARISVSCTIAPAMEISSAARYTAPTHAKVRPEFSLSGKGASMAVVKSNMGTQYFMSESVRPGAKVITATAL
jgi:hypothetical protein